MKLERRQRKNVGFTLVSIFFIFCITLPDLAQSGVCYKKYQLKSGKCRGKIRSKGNRGRGIDLDFGKCCRRKDANGWKPKRGSRYCIRCPEIVDGGWSEWSEWTECPVKCDWGFRDRERKCNNPEPKHGGKQCKGANKQREKCYAGVRCPIHGKWGNWSEWSTCSKSCKTGGRQIRSRRCDSPQPQFGGDDCFGPSDESKSCNEDVQCPVDGNWNSWSSWSQCSTTCNSGVMQRSRKCNKPAPKYGGKICEGNANEDSNCFRKICSNEKDNATSGSGSGSEETSRSGSGSGEGSSGSGSASGKIYPGLEVDSESGEDGEPVRPSSNKTVDVKVAEGSGEGSGSGSGSKNTGDNESGDTAEPTVAQKGGSASGTGNDSDNGSGSSDSNQGEVMVEGPAGDSLARQAKVKGTGDKKRKDKKNGTNSAEKGAGKDEKGPGWGNEFEEL